jgi:hypothetical protein
VREKGIVRKVGELDSSLASKKFALVLARSVEMMEEDILKTLRLRLR